MIFKINLSCAQRRRDEDSLGHRYFARKAVVALGSTHVYLSTLGVRRKYECKFLHTAYIYFWNFLCKAS
jgi:hypothetical protein